MKLPNQAIKFAPYGRRTLVPRAVYGERYAEKAPGAPPYIKVEVLNGN